MLRILHDFAAQHKGKRLYLFGCTDDYAAMLIRRKAELTESISPPAPPLTCTARSRKRPSSTRSATSSASPYPDTKILTAPVDAAELTAEKLGFAYPIIVKPSSSVDYWKHPFDTMKKVYTPPPPLPRPPRSCAPSTQAATLTGCCCRSWSRAAMTICGADRLLGRERQGPRDVLRGHTMVEGAYPHGLGNHAAIVSEDTTSLPLVENIRKCWRPATTPASPTLTSSTAAPRRLPRV